VHSGPEALRHEFNAEVSQKDLWETYLPAFEKLVTESHAEGVMGAYNRTNGEPCCGSKTLLVDLLRGRWGFDGYITSDCWAIKDFHTGHNVTSGPLESVALAIKNGCNLNCGNMYYQILACVQAGLLTEEDVRASAVRLMTTRMRLGLFDEHTEYDDIPYDVVDCPEHRAYNLKTAERSIVLLDNHEGFLPLDPAFAGKVAVIGPVARSTTALEGNYNGNANEYVTVLDGLKEALPRAQFICVEGSALDRAHVDTDMILKADSRISEAITVASRSDLVVLAVGLDRTVEGEEMSSRKGSYSQGGDKPGVTLPDCQRALIEAVLATGKPTVVVVLTGSAIDMPEAQGRAKAILHAWYPGAQGGRALARILTGAVSPSARLPLTFYRADDELPAFTDYAMEGRTYRFMKTEPRYPFGFGLSYAAFTYSGLQLPAQVKSGEDAIGSVRVKNLSNLAAEEVVQIYVRDQEASVRVPHFQLVCTVRLALDAGEEKEVPFRVPAYWLCVVQEDGSRVSEPGSFILYAGGSQPDPVSVKLLGKEPLSTAFQLI